MAISPFLQAALLAACSELGDRTFFLVAVLGAWCPFQGPARAWARVDARLRSCMVLLGCVLALATHAGLAAGGASPAAWNNGACALEAVMLALLWLKCLADYWNAPEPGDAKGPAPVADLGFEPNPYASQLASASSSAHASEGRGEDAPLRVPASPSPFLPPSGLPAPADGDDGEEYARRCAQVREDACKYGTVPDLPADPEGVLGTASSLAFSFLLAFSLSLVGEFGDKSYLLTSKLAAEAHKASGGVWFVLGSSAGYSAVASLAVFVGHVVGRELPERRLLFGAGVALLMLSLTSASQALTGGGEHYGLWDVAALLGTGSLRGR